MKRWLSLTRFAGFRDRHGPERHGRGDRGDALRSEVALGAAIVAGGILMHYLVARGLAAWRDGQRANVLVAAGD
jgi:hypothetical protein